MAFHSKRDPEKSKSGNFLPNVDYGMKDEFLSIVTSCITAGFQ
jgi:hypothetical protein